MRLGVVACAVLMLPAMGAAAQGVPQWGDPLEPGSTVLAQAAAPVPPPPPPPSPRLASLREGLGLPAALPLSGGGPSLTLSEALRLGLVNSPDVQAANYREQSFAETRNAARGALLPHLEVRIAAGRGHLESVEPKLALNRGDTTAVMTQSLIDEPARAEWGRQELLASSAEEQRAGAESQALLDTANAWLAVMQQRVALELGNEFETLLNELLRYVGERAAAGGASPAERERVAARVANVRSGLADSRASLAAALRNLQRLAAVTPGAVALDGSIELLPVPRDPESAITQARTGNADLRSAALEQRAAEAEREGFRGRFMPRLSIELTHARARNASGTEAYTRDNKAMAVLTLPIATGGADLAQLRAAEARRLELEARAEGTLRRVVQDIETSYANLRASGERLVSVREELDGNRKVVDAFRAQLVGGNRPLLDVLDAYQRLHQSRLDLVQVLVSTLQNEWRIAHLTGALRGQAPLR